VRVVQAVDFVSDNPSYAGTMTMTWEVTEVDGGTRVDIIADNVPDGIAAKDHAAGLASSLMNLAEYLEGRGRPEIRRPFAMHSRAGRGDGFWDKQGKMQGKRASKRRSHIT